jgi:enoyl-CoA hydratase/carnithine racemase
MSEGLKISQDGALLTAEISNGPENEFTEQMCRELTEVLMSPPRDSSVLLLKASGENFCLGRDRSSSGAAEVRAMAQALGEVNVALVSSRLSVVARVSGDAKGFGVGLVGLSDVAVAQREARFSLPEVHGGFSPALVLAWLPYVVGRREAFRMASTGVSLTSSEAHRLGLVNEVVAADELDVRVKTVVESLLSVPSSVHAHIKSDLLLREWLSMREETFAAVERLSLRTLALAEQRSSLS